MNLSWNCIVSVADAETGPARVHVTFFVFFPHHVVPRDAIVCTSVEARNSIEPFGCPFVSLVSLAANIDLRDHYVWP